MTKTITVAFPFPWMAKAITFNGKVDPPTTRDVMKKVVLAALCAAIFTANNRAAEPKKVLMFTKSSAFEHSVVRRGPDGSLGLAERIVKALGEKHGFAVDVTKDGREINADNLAQYSAVLFFTQGELTQSGRDGQPPMREEDKPALLQYVENGGGFVGTHCGGADTFHEWTEFRQMVGGLFIGHGPQQEGWVDIVDPSFPAVAGWPKSFSMIDEWYAYSGFNKNMHVLMMLRTEGLEGRDKLYDRADYPITWCSKYGQGRVFYTGLGHREDVWSNPLYQDMIAKALLWAIGEIDGDASPNLRTLFGDEEKALIRINPK